jgi:hypothetical protein
VWIAAFACVTALAVVLCGFGGEQQSAAFDPKAARQEIDRVLPEICNVVMAYYQTAHSLPPGTGETPAADVEAIDGTFGPDPNAWLARPTWAALQYFPDGVQRWRYAFESRPFGFTVIATHDGEAWHMDGAIENGAIRLLTRAPVSGSAR